MDRCAVGYGRPRGDTRKPDQVRSAMSLRDRAYALVEHSEVPMVRGRRPIRLHHE